MKFDFGCARQLYEKNVHPRVMLGPEDVMRLRKRIGSGDARTLMRAIRRKVRPQIEWVLACKDLAEAFTSVKIPRATPAYSALGGALEMAFLAILDDDADAAEALRRLFANEAWIEFRGRTALPSPLAYDLAFHVLPEASKTAYRRAVTADTLKRVRGAGPQYFRMSGHNITLGTGLYAFWGLLAIQGDPGVPDFGAEKTRLLRMLSATMHVVYGPDGYPEEDMGYGTGVGGSMSHLAEALRRAGLYEPYEDCPQYAAFGRALLHFVQPWGEALSTTGDHGDDFGGREFVLPRLAHETRDPTLLWLMSTLTYGGPDAAVRLSRGLRTQNSAYALFALDDLARPVHPAVTPGATAGVPTPFRDRARGIVSFRSGWKADDTFVVFDGSQRSPSAQGHFHSSCGHFSLSALGEYFAIDTGRYNMEQNCHNVVLIDGKSGRSTNGEWAYAKHHGLLTDYQPGAFVDFAAVDSSHQHDCYWARRYLGLVKGRGGLPSYAWVVDDINKADDWAEYEWQLHTSPENTIVTRKHGASIKGWRHGHWLDVHWILPPADEYAPPHALLNVKQDVAVPSSYKYVANPQKRVADFARPSDMLHYSTFTRPRLTARIGGLNGRFLSVLIPRRRGETPAKVTRLESVPNSLAVRVTGSDVEDTVIFAYEHNLLEAGAIAGRGQWCVVRRSIPHCAGQARTGRVLARALGHGTRLSVGGRRLE